jgi:tRNA A-37 threonylcarbamoyl transferase component Bud32
LYHANEFLSTVPKSFPLQRKKELEFSEDTSLAALTTSYVEGVTLEQYVQKNQVSPKQYITWTDDILGQLKTAYNSGFSYGEVNDQNIIITSEDRAVIIDVNRMEKATPSSFGVDEESFKEFEIHVGKDSLLFEKVLRYN